jgi:hypothetical protein
MQGVRKTLQETDFVSDYLGSRDGAIAVTGGMVYRRGDSTGTVIVRSVISDSLLYQGTYETNASCRLVYDPFASYC